MTDDRPGWGEQRSLEITWNDPAATLPFAMSLSGLDYFTKAAAGELPGPPILNLVGGRLASVADGEVAFEVDPHESHMNPIGVVHGGIACTMLDSAVGCAVHTTLEAGWGYTSIDLNVSYLRAITLTSGTITYTGRVIKRGKRVMFASGEATDAAGNVVATATSSLLVIAPR